MSTLPNSIDDALALLARADYVAERSLATAVFLALKMNRPLFLEGEAGVGKTEIAKVLASGLGRPLVRLQCYEGLDIASAVYEWNYSRQMIEIRLAETQGTSRDTVAKDIFSERFLIKRPLMQALEGGKGPEASEILSREVVTFVQRLRKMDLFKLPGVAETIDWSKALVALDKMTLDPQTVNDTLGTLLKYQDDITRVRGSDAERLLAEVRAELAAA